jgi:hypothetical protein
MVTKADLEVELDRLRTLSESLRQKAEQGSPIGQDRAASDPERLAAEVHRVLEEHGIDSSSIKAIGAQFVDELARIQKHYPLAVVLGAFALGCIAGRALR